MPTLAGSGEGEGVIDVVSRGKVVQGLHASDFAYQVNEPSRPITLLEIGGQRNSIKTKKMYINEEAVEGGETCVCAYDLAVYIL